LYTPIHPAPWKVKLLGLTSQSDLRWNTHIDNIVSECSKRLCFLVQQKSANVPARDIIQFYMTCVRPVLEYSSNVFNYSLPTYLNDDIERIQKRALSIAQPEFKYEDSLAMIGLSTLREREEINLVRTFLIKSWRTLIINFLILYL
jgi:hypothetical protein